MRRQLFRSRLARAASNCHNRFSPRGVDAMREQLQRRNRIVNQQQPILETLKIAQVIFTSDRCYGPSRKRIADKLMRIDKLTIKTGAGVVLLRERKEELARAY